MTMAATLHVRCPICGHTVDCVIPKETWGESIPGDTGCGNVTLFGEMTTHVTREHSGEDHIRALAKHHERQIEWSTQTLASMRERHPDILGKA